MILLSHIAYGKTDTISSTDIFSNLRILQYYWPVPKPVAIYPVSKPSVG
jgi:hypothetical protein